MTIEKERTKSQAGSIQWYCIFCHQRPSGKQCIFSIVYAIIAIFLAIGSFTK